MIKNGKRRIPHGRKYEQYDEAGSEDAAGNAQDAAGA